MEVKCLTEQNRTEQNRQTLHHAKALIVATHVIANDSEAICSVNGKHKGRCFGASNLFKRLLRKAKSLQLPSPMSRSDVRNVKTPPCTSLRDIGLMVLKIRGSAKQSEKVFSSFAFRLSPKFGFSLAEVLITLGIIGVVAAISIPALLNNIQDAQYKTAYKKAYTSLSQAVQQANNNNELTKAVSSGSPPTDFQNNFLAIMSKFTILKQCINDNNQQCWDSSGEKYGLSYSGGYPLSSAYAFMDSSGMAWSQYWSGALRIFVDTNGFKKPNQWGKDRFVLRVMDKNNADEFTTDIPIKVIPEGDNNAGCCYGNKCGTAGNRDYNTYYGTRWLYN